MAVADLEQYCLDPLLLDGLAVLLGHAEPLAVEADRLLEVLDGDAYVIDGPEQTGRNDTGYSSTRSAAASLISPVCSRTKRWPSCEPS